MLRGETKSILHLLINCMQSADTLLICITQQKKQLILRSLYYHPKAKLVFFLKNHKNVRPEAYETMGCSFHPDQCNV